jgi:gliding motility-associated-like protein
MTSTGINDVYEWQTTNGLLIPPIDQPTLSVNAAGEYQLIVQDTVSFCADTASVNVLDQTSLPAVIIADGFTLNCQLRQDTLDGSASLINAAFTANWSGPCINTTLEPAIVTVECPGWYILEVENTSTGCINRDSILIEENIEPAVAAIAPLSDILNCNILQVELNASSSNPAGLLTYEWDGPGMPPANQAQVLVNEAGNYQLIVTRTDNFCRDTAMILVTQDTLAPVADAGPDLELNCNFNLLDAYTQGTNSSSGSTISYQWFSDNLPLPGETNDSLQVTTSGTYILEVTNNENGCSDLDTVNITEDFLPPELVQAGPDAPLNCAGDIVFLTPDSTGFSRPVDWTWEGPCFTTPTDTWSVATDCAGLYTLTVTNQDNGCSAFDTVRVTASNNFSQAILADEILALDCNTGTATLNTTGSIGSVFRWFRDGVNISLPNNNPVINQAGMYILVTSDASMVCSDTARTEVIIDCPTLAVIASPDTINCRQNLISLSAAGSTTNGAVTYQWTGPSAGCFVDDPQQSTVTVVCPGTYQLILEQTLFGLRDTTLVEVLIDTVAPVVNAGENLQVTCAVPVPTLTGSVVGNPDDYSFTWTDFSGTDTLSFTSEFSTDLPGSYFFVAENISNGCTSRDIAQITLNNVDIDIAFGSSVFPCLTDTFRLEAFVSPTDTNYIYQWSGPGIVSDANSLNALINTTGQYVLSVENPLNGCSAMNTIMVTDQICAPCLNLSATDTLNCLSDELMISASFCASCNGCTLQWSDENGPISGANNLNLTVNTAGQYTLMATDLLGFSSSVSVEVFDLTTPPLLHLGPDRILTCDSTSFVLQNQLFNTHPNLRYEWSLLDGTILNTDSTLTVAMPGSYILTLTDLLSSCAVADTINITQDIESPVAEAGSDQLLTCENNIVLLDGSASTLANATYAWTGPAAGCLAGAQTTTPIASCEGLYFLQVTLNRNGCTAQDSVNVIRNEALPNITPIPDTVINCLQPTVVLAGNAPNMDGYSVSWCALDGMGNAILTSCDTFLNYTVIAGGDYQFTLVNDTTLCSSSFNVSVAVDSLPPFVEAGQTDTLSCGDSTSMLSGSVDSETSFNWTGPADASILPDNSLSPTVDRAGWYFLMATSNNNGCSAIDSMQVVLDENVPTLNASPDTLLNCNNVTIHLHANGSTNSGNSEWQWTTQTGTIVGASNTPDLTVADSAWYVVTLLDPVNSCSVTDSVFVGLDNVPPIAMIDGIDTLTCTLDTLTLDALNSVSSSGEGLTFNWQVINGQLFPDLGEAQVFTDRPGTYQLIVEDFRNGCTDTLLFDIESNKVLPDLTLAIPDSLGCSVDSVLLQTIIPATEPGFNFQWNDEDGALISETATAFAFEPGRYYLLLESEENGCTSLDSVDVFARDDYPVVNIASPLPLTCLRLAVTLDASASSDGANYTYQWSSSSGGSLLGTTSSLVDSTAMAGTYQLIITDTITGCQREDSVQVISKVNPIVGIDLEITPPPCDGGSTGQEQGSISVNGVMGGTPPYLYSLNNEPFESISFFEDLPVGPYQLSIRDSGGCIWEESTTLRLPIGIILDLGPDLEIELGDSVQIIPQFSQVIDSFYWESFGLFPTYTTTLRPNISPKETQFILLTVIDENGCSATDTLRIFVKDDIDIFIPNAFSPNGDGENDLFTIYGGPEINRIRSLRIFSRWGNLVYERRGFLPNNPNNSWDGTLRGEPLNPAVFVYQLEVLVQGRGLQVITGEVLLMR